MISVRFSGGLGNQMFQYACGKSLAIKNGLKHVIADLSFYKRQGWDNTTARLFDLEVFNINIVRKDIPVSIYFKIVGLRHYKEKEGGVDNKVLTLKGNIELEGYWQSEKYFLDIEDEVRNDFIFKPAINEKNKGILEKIRKSNSVSVHVRRGDYANNPKIKSIHGVDLSSYYPKAVEYINKRIRNPRYFVFSDDIDWCKKNLKPGSETYYVDSNKGTKSFEDMRLMCNCKHNIIANSSFSWWGAWLNNNPEKIIIAPKKWFNNPNTAIKDRLPAKWIKI